MSGTSLGSPITIVVILKFQEKLPSKKSGQASETFQPKYFALTEEKLTFSIFPCSEKTSANQRRQKINIISVGWIDGWLVG